MKDFCLVSEELSPLPVVQPLKRDKRAVQISGELLFSVSFLSDPSKYRNLAASIKTEDRICAAEIGSFGIDFNQDGWSLAPT